MHRPTVYNSIHKSGKWKEIFCKLTSSSMRAGLVRSSHAIFALFFSPPDNPLFR